MPMDIGALIIPASVVVPAAVLVMFFYWGKERLFVRVLLAAVHTVYTFGCGCCAVESSRLYVNDGFYIVCILVLGVALSLANLRAGVGYHEWIGWIGLLIWGLHGNLLLIFVPMMNHTLTNGLALLFVFSVVIAFDVWIYFKAVKLNKLAVADAQPRMGVCYFCQYDLQGNPTATHCPECGTVVEPAATAMKCGIPKKERPGEDKRQEDEQAK